LRPVWCTATTSGATGGAWWQTGVIYQIYPRSFQDSNADGTGDLPGIISRLEYLRSSGVTAIWISPIFPSPMADFGYDVADYVDIDPLFGTLDDFDQLVAEAHQRNIRVILDYVPNHTSDQHAWFRESRTSRTSPKRDWYIWRDPHTGGGPPNNWLSAFGGSAWEWDPNTEQYYLHTYLREQPDLNWRNPAVQDAMYDVLRFWFSRGVDGMRIDALRQVMKDAELRDNPPNPHWGPDDDPAHQLLTVHSADQPELMDIVHRFREISDEYPERVLIGELWLPIERLVTYYGRDNRGLQLPFNFHLILTPWTAKDIAALVDVYEAALPPGAWPNWVLGNHDRSRVATRVGAEQARVAAMLLLTLRGTPTLYNGDEIGMHDVPIPPDEVQDPFELNVPGKGLGRDPERTPMQWDNTPNAGFSAADARPWLPLASDYAPVNVAAQERDERSLLSLHRRLIALRATTPVLATGSYRRLHVDDCVLAYERTEGNQRLLVALNLSHAPQTIAWPHQARVIVSTFMDRADSVGAELSLRADEGLLLEPF
jgi:alpha-glucosidase